MRKYLLSFAAIGLLAVSGSVRAQNPAPEDQQSPPQDPPTAQVGQVPPGQDQYPQAQDQQSQDSQTPAEPQPGAARVSFVHGDVSSQRGDTGEWVAVTLNTPVMAGDHIATGKKSHAEFQLDHANILRLSNEATAKIVNLNRTSIQLQIGQGLVTYSVLKGSEADVEIDTPNVAIHLSSGEGVYRILVNNDAQTEVIVRNGSAEISTSQGSTRVGKGQEVEIAGTDNPQYKVAQAPGKDDWDKWNNDRDHLIADADSWNHTNRNYTGAQDLDTYGTWSTVPDYGPVWVPRVSAGWAPYRAGRWVWYPYYGWTWVSYEPWGWAPYHYGRWFVYGGGWAWWPGPAYVGYRPLWAPAYVSFFGFGHGGGFSFGVGFGFGNVGWLPIGPCDGFYPWYGRWGSRVTVVNFNNFHNNRFNGSVRPIQPLARGFRHPYSNMSEAFTNPRVRSGFSSMPGNQFGHGAVPGSQRGIDQAGFRQASMMTGGLPAKADRESMRPTDRQVNTRDLPRSATTSQHFFSRSQTPTSRDSFRGQSTTQTQHNTGVDTSRNGNPGGFRTSGETPRGGSTATMRSSSTDVRGSAPTSQQHQMGLPPVRQTQTGPSGWQSGGWQHYNPSEHPSQPGSTMRQTQSPMSRGGNSASGRPPLDLRQPIVTPRSNPTYNGSRGTYGGAPPSNGSRGSYGGAPVPPSSGSRGSYSAPPSSGSRGSYSPPPSSGSRGGYSPAPSGGRGPYSAPSPSRGQAPQRSSGGESHSGGGGRSSGGGSHGSSNGGGHPHK